MSVENSENTRGTSVPFGTPKTLTSLSFHRPLRGASLLIRLSFALGPTVPPPFCRVTGRRGMHSGRGRLVLLRDALSSHSKDPATGKRGQLRELASSVMNNRETRSSGAD
jgi:hypothetical protein